MPELRTDFHHDLEEIRDAIVRLGATVISGIKTGDRFVA
mgnify:CR=1 FL=1